MARPTGITILAIVEILLGIFALIGGVGHLLLGIGGLVTFSGTDANLMGLASALGDLFTVEGLILLVAGYGVWASKSWGWMLSLGIVIIGILTSIPILYPLGSVGAAPALIINIILLIYLMTSGVRDYFKSQASPTTQSK